MTEKAVLQTPHVETVILGLSMTIERDYIQRGVFPALRNQNAVTWSGSTGFHHLTIDEAEALLEDARARLESAFKWLKNAYSSHVRALGGAIKEAKTRRGKLETKEPFCEYKDENCEFWHGTKEQLLAIGICLDGPWPGEPGGKLSWAKATDKRGYPLRLSRYSTTWGTTYRVRIEIPQQDRRGKEVEEQRAIKRYEAQIRLRDMPSSADGFRRDLVKSIRHMLQCFIPAKPSEWHGYALDDESVTAILVSGDAVVEAIMAAKVNFDAKRHQEIALGYKKAIAEADNAFQDKLSLLTKPNAKILEGEVS